MRCHVISFLKFDFVLSKVVKCFVLVTALPFIKEIEGISYYRYDVFIKGKAGVSGEEKF